jgi:hypothetical protein
LEKPNGVAIEVEVWEGRTKPKKKKNDEITRWLLCNERITMTIKKEGINNKGSCTSNNKHGAHD